MAQFFVPYGEEEIHAAALRAGLKQMAEGFSAYVCEICKGQGSYDQRYNAGCGMGYYTSKGDCDYCGATGLCQGSGMRNAAPVSVINQVLIAGRSILDGGREP